MKKIMLKVKPFVKKDELIIRQLIAIYPSLNEV